MTRSEATPPDADTAVDPFARWRLATRARIGLGRSGDALPTAALLDFQLAHSRARDAVHGTVDFAAMAASLTTTLTAPVLRVHSRAADRGVYLRRPDLGRRVDVAVLPRLDAARGDHDLVLVIADGLSAAAVEAQVPALLEALLPLLASLRIAPLVLAQQARVALGDEIGERLGARLVAVLIGERPGLSAADSLGVYLTHAPRVGRSDAERNCISNIHTAGLAPAAAAATLAWLIRQALQRGVSGVSLKLDVAMAQTLLPADDHSR